MSDSTPVTSIPTTVSTTATQATINDLATDIDLIKKLISAGKTGGMTAVAADAPEAIADVSKTFSDVQAAIPEIKVGYKTTEFWVPVVSMVGGIIYFRITGKDIPVNLTAGATALIGIYIAVRAMLKAKQVAATAAVAAASVAANAVKK